MDRVATQKRQDFWGDRWVALGLKIILLVMPLHAFLTIVLGQFLGHRPIWQAWKELLILVLAGIAGAGLVHRDRLKRLYQPKFFLLAILLLWALFISVLAGSSLKSIIFGLKTDFAPLLVFTIAYLSASFWKNKKSLSLPKIILIPAGVVLIAGFLQAFVVPVGWLSWLGYNSSTINPQFLVDPAISAIRLFSTLSGPNQLGAYLILPICLCIALLLRRADWRVAPLLIGLLWLSYNSYSRSSWIGLVVAGFVTILLSLRGKWRIGFVILSLVVGLIGGIKVYYVITSPQNSHLQYLLLHGRVNVDHVEGSDAGRTSSQENAISAIRAKPFGHGLGSAGPASQHVGAGLVTENWYLQIAVELGLVGLVLFLTFIGLCLFELGQKIHRRSDSVRIALFGAIVGLSVTNLFLHSWADATLGLMIFTLLGIELGQKQ